MNILLSIVYLALGFTIGIFLYAQMLLPLIYGLPRSLYLFFNGDLRRLLKKREFDVKVEAK